MVPDGVERKVLDCDEPTEDRRRPAFDKALGGRAHRAPAASKVSVFGTVSPSCASRVAMSTVSVPAQSSNDVAGNVCSDSAATP